jgi:GxxExxY protein
MDNLLRNIANEIYKELGSGHRECVYHRAFEIELRNSGIDYECEVVAPLFYKGQFVSHIRLDLVVAKTWIVELKATRALKDDDAAQLNRYMNITGIPLGALVNFGGSNGVEFCVHRSEN